MPRRARRGTKLIGDGALGCDETGGPLQLLVRDDWCANNTSCDTRDTRRIVRSSLLIRHRQLMDATEPNASVREEVSRSGSLAADDVVGVRERARAQREAAAADAVCQATTEGLEHPDPLVESLSPSARDASPFLRRGRLVDWKLLECLDDLFERQPDPLGDADEGDPPQHVPSVAPLVPLGPLGSDQPASLVEPDGGRREAASLCDLADGELTLHYLASMP